jgi:hypothetical protein
MRPEKKYYRIYIYKKINLTDEQLVGQIDANWIPEDEDKFAWDLGGDRVVVEELPDPSIPPES